MAIRQRDIRSNVFDFKLMAFWVNQPWGIYAVATMKGTFKELKIYVTEKDENSNT